jgi:hypothetical protein
VFDRKLDTTPVLVKIFFAQYLLRLMIIAVVVVVAVCVLVCMNITSFIVGDENG